jgi:hypothetical protein
MRWHGLVRVPTRGQQEVLAEGTASPASQVTRMAMESQP